MKKTIWICLVFLVLVGLVVWRSRLPSPEPNKTSSQRMGSSEDSGMSAQASSIAEGARPVVKDDKNVVATEPELSDAVKLLAGLDGRKHGFQEYRTAVGNLGEDLSAEEIEALRVLLESNSTPLSKLSPINANAVKNDVLKHLISLEELPEGLGQQIVEMYSNPENDPVWRDYCIQFMTPYYERVAGGATSSSTMRRIAQTPSQGGADSADAIPPNAELALTREALEAALDERDGSFAGTSLIALERLSRSHEEFDRKAILAKTVDIAQDGSASTASRLTALRLAAQTCSELDEAGRDTTLDLARNLAETGETQLMRGAAIVTLGEIGSEEERLLLESYAQSSQRQLASAAKLALEKMDVRE